MAPGELLKYDASSIEGIEKYLKHYYDFNNVLKKIE